MRPIKGDTRSLDYNSLGTTKNAELFRVQGLGMFKTYREALLTSICTCYGNLIYVP